MEQLRQIEYEPDFKELVNKNPGALKSFLKIEQEIKKKFDDRTIQVDEEFEDGNVKVTPLYEYIEEKNFYVQETKDEPTRIDSYLKVEIGEDKFFVKTIPGYMGELNGADELLAARKLKAALKDFDNVEVLNFQFGYQSATRTYFVSKWIDLPTLDDVEIDFMIGAESRSEEKSLKIKEIFERAQMISDKLEEMGFIDIHEKNMFYDKETDKMYLYDLAHEDVVSKSMKVAA